MLVLASDVATGASASPVDLTGLSFAYEPNSRYIFDMHMFTISSASTNGHGFQVNTTTAVNKVGLLFVHQLAASGTLSGGSSVAVDSTIATSNGTPSTTEVFSSGKGILVTGSTGGTATFRYKSEGAVLTTCNAESTIIVTKIV